MSILARLYHWLGRYLRCRICGRPKDRAIHDPECAVLGHREQHTTAIDYFGGSGSVSLEDASTKCGFSCTIITDFHRFSPW